LSFAAVATALAAIVGLVTLLWPDSPARLAANLDHLAIDANVALSEFAARQRVTDTGAASDLVVVLAPEDGDGNGPVLAAGHRSLAATPLAQSPEGGEVPSQVPEDQPQPEGGEPSPTGPEDGEASPTEPGDGEPPQVPERGSSESQSDSEVVGRVKAKLPPEKLPDGCTYEGSSVVCGKSDEGVLRSLLPATDVADAPSGGAVADAEALVTVLENTRARPVSSGGTEPLGVTLSFDLALEGFSDKKAVVRWSLYDAGAREASPAIGS